MKLLLVVLLGGVSTAFVAHAQPPLDADADADAEELAQAGMEHFSAHRYQQALAAFQQLYDEVPSPQLRFNIAMCYERLGRLTDAVSTYDDALSDALLDDEGRVRAEARLQELRPRLATLVIESGSELTARIDDARECAVPCRVAVDPGVHVVSAIDASGIDPERVSVAPGQELRVWLEERPLEAERQPEPRVVQERAWSPGWLFWSGAGLIAAGTAGLVGFGLSVRDLETEFIANPTEQTADRGELMELLANVSIAAAAAGATAMVVDLLFPSAGTEHVFAVGPQGLTARGRF